MKIINKILLNNGKNKEREIQFLGFPLFQYGKKEGNGTKERYFEIFPKSLEHKALDKILKFIPKDSKHDHIWIVRTIGLGEAQLLNFMMDELVKKWKVKNPCFVSHRKIYKEMFGMYTDIPFYHIDLPHDEFALDLKNMNIKYKGKYFHIHHCTIADSAKLVKNWRNGSLEHAIPIYLQIAGINSFNNAEIKFTEALKNSTLNNVQKINLNLDKFIFLSPQAQATKQIEDEFWEKLTEYYEQQGFDVYVNTSDGKSQYGKTTYLNIAESIYLASLAKKIIALRCGYSEILSAIPARNNIYVLYSNCFKTVPAKQFYEIFSLKEYPFYNSTNTYEFIIEKDNLDEIFEQIIR